MRRFNVNEGTRAEVLAELDQYVEDTKGRSPEKYTDYLNAREVIRCGGDQVDIRHSRYIVVEQDDERSTHRISG